MIRILYRHRSGTVILDCPPDQLPAALKDPQSRFWIDLSAPTREEYDRILVEAFHFHPLAIDDAINDVHVPKIDDWSILYSFHSFSLGEGHDIDSDEIDVFLGSNFLNHQPQRSSSSIEKLWTAEYLRNILARGPARCSMNCSISSLTTMAHCSTPLGTGGRVGDAILPARQRVESHAG